MSHSLGTATGRDLYEVSQDVSVLENGERYSITFLQENTGPARLRFNRVAIRSILDAQGMLLQGKEIAANSVIIMIYDGGSFRLTSAITPNAAALPESSADIDFEFMQENRKLRPELRPTGVSAGTYGGSGRVPVMTIDDKGRVTDASEEEITASEGGMAKILLFG